jgi:DNA-binding MarR family transcriptional regulator
MKVSHQPRSIDLAEVKGCMLLRVRRLARRAATIYDRRLEPAGLTISQFGLMAQIQGTSRGGGTGPSIGVVAERFGMDPTTLNRALKPLVTQAWVKIETDPADRRAKILSITAKGRAKLAQALPLWREAEAEVEAAIGVDTKREVSRLIDLATDRLAE